MGKRRKIAEVISNEPAKKPVSSDVTLGDQDLQGAFFSST
jgi:hypothetical protein